MHTTLLSTGTITTLALSDTATYTLTGVQMIFNVVLALGLLWQKSRIEKITSLESQIKGATSQLVEQRIQQVNERISNSIQMMAKDIHAINERLRDGDHTMREQDRADRELDQRLWKAIDELKDLIRHECVSKSELKALADEVKKLSGKAA